MDVSDQMDRSQKKRRRSSKPYHGFSGKFSTLLDLKSSRTDPLLTDGAFGEGEQMKRRMDVQKMQFDSGFGSGFPAEQNLVSNGFRRSSSRKGSGTPIKMLLAEEMSKEMVSKHQSLNVVARLMGLDALPTQQPVHKQPKFSKGHSQRTRPVVFQEKHVIHEDHASLKINNQEQEFKDVFEVLETTNVKKKKALPVQKVMPCSKLSEAKMAFIRQKLLDARCFSTDENPHQLEEFPDAVDVLGSNKDLFLKFLQEPDYLFTKHLHDLQVVQSPPHTNDVRVRKSSMDAKNDNGEPYQKSERDMGYMQLHMGSLQKQEDNRIDHDQHDFYLRHKLLRSQFEGKNDSCHLPTRIVVLKPSFKNVEDPARSVSSPSSSGNSRSSLRNQRELWRFRSWEPFPELKDRSKLVNDVDFVRHRPRALREAAREVNQRMRRTASRDSNVSTSAWKGYTGDESSDSMSVKDFMKESNGLIDSSKHLYDKSSRCSPSSSSYSAESSLSREAKKRLSERWKMAQKFQEVGHCSKGSRTLGEMLSRPDGERLLTGLDSKRAQTGSTDRPSGSEVLEKWDCPLGISSRDGWKSGNLMNLPRSRSLPKSSTLYGSKKSRSTHAAFGSDNCSISKGDESFTEDSDPKVGPYSIKVGAAGKKSVSYFDMSIENDLIIQEIHGSPNDMKHGLSARFLSEHMPIVPDPSTFDVGDMRYLGEHASVSEYQAGKMIPRTGEDPVSEPTACTVLSNDKHSISNCFVQNDIIVEETALSELQMDSHCDVVEPESPGSSKEAEQIHHELQVTSHFLVAEPQSPQCSKEAEQPSPISVLEPPYEAEISSSDCFERVSAELHGLRMQLQLLKLESTEEPTDELDVTVSSDEDSVEGCTSFVEDKSVSLRLYRNLEDRDFFFILDVLIDSGFHGADQEMAFATSYSLESPVDPCVFENLEKKYAVQVDWPRWERRLLFDCINTALAEILKPHMDLHPWVKPKGRSVAIVWDGEGLTEKVWQLLIKHGKVGIGDTAENVLADEVGWLELGDDVDVIGKEVEKLLLDELMEDVVFAFYSCREL